MAAVRLVYFTSTSLSVNADTTRRAFKISGYKDLKLTPMPGRTPKMRAARLQFSKAHKNMFIIEVQQWSWSILELYSREHVDALLT